LLFLQNGVCLYSKPMLVNQDLIEEESQEG
jgi:hypothetical protein